MLFAGLIFSASGGAIAWLFGNDVTLYCARDQNLCRIESGNLLGDTSVIEEFPLDSLRSATVANKSSRSRKSGSKTTYQVQLQTDQGVYTFSSIWTSDHEKHKKSAETINRFLKSKDNALQVTESGQTMRYFGFAFAGAGLLTLFGAIWRIVKQSLLSNK